MKRRRAPTVADTACPKRPANDAVVKAAKISCPLIQILAQYGLLVSITTHLFPKDLYSLAATSKAAYKTIFPRIKSRSSLLKKMQCDGSGIGIRLLSQKRSQYSVAALERACCGTFDKTRKVESRPCVKCCTNTCDECRVHCVYQSIRQPADEPDELDSYSGFVLLNGEEMGILSPAHLCIDNASPWNDQPHHDSGFLDNPLDSSVFASPVDIDRLINADLGACPLTVTLSSGTPHPSPVIRAFWEITEERKRPCCTQCFSKYATRNTEMYTKCRCTLKSRFLDRWLCLKCHQSEQQAIHTIAEHVQKTYPEECSCGNKLDDDETERIICLWCNCEVANTRDVVSEEESSAISSD